MWECLALDLLGSILYSSNENFLNVVTVLGTRWSKRHCLPWCDVLDMSLGGFPANLL
jgi:hypothetical protein